MPNPLVAIPLGCLGVILTLWCIWFFRDPKRSVPQRKGLIVAPADGQVLLIERAPLPEELEELATGQPLLRVSIFMSVFNAHINRAPVSGIVEKIVYRPGKFFSAGLDKASRDNERSTMVLRQDNGERLVVVQIAGLIARRILCFVKPDTRLEVGERYGMIRFGSRVDIYLPDGTEPLVCEGQTIIGGETIIADLNSKELARVAKIQ